MDYEYYLKASSDDDGVHEDSEYITFCSPVSENNHDSTDNEELHAKLSGLSSTRTNDDNHTLQDSTSQNNGSDQYYETIDESIIALKKMDMQQKKQDKEFNELLLTKVTNFEDREFDFLRVVPPIKRSTSLKPLRPKSSNCLSGSSGLTSPGRRKTVRFADALGLDLTSVRHIINPEEPPVVPSAVRQTLERDIDTEEHTLEVAFWKLRWPQLDVTSADFLRKVLDRKVILESCSVNNRDLRVHGVVRVANLGFTKSVTVRYSENGWMTYNDVQARYVTDSNDLATDRFYFFFNVPGHLGVRNRIEFAIMYTVSGQTFWDSNHGYNYALECIHHLGYE